MNMKKIVIIIATAGLLFSCNKLSLEPVSSITTSELYTTQSNALAGIAGVYASLTYDETGDQALYGRNLYFLTDMGADYAAAGASAINPFVQSISHANISSTIDRLDVAWRQIYTGIDLANLAVDNLPNSQVQDPLKTRLINEAKFIRALLYFDAVRLWGRVPLVLHEPTSLSTLKTNQSPVDSVYAQIISDLTSAQNLPASYTGADIGRATSGAATSLLAKVYLTRKDWADAITNARAVVNSGTYDLFPSFFNVFNKNTKNGIEHIFSAQYSANQAGNGATGNTLTSACFKGFSTIQPADIIADTTLFYNIYQQGDTRRDVSYAKELVNPATGLEYVFPTPVFKKFLDTTGYSTLTNNPINNPIIRYADILLTLAEADNEQNGGPNAEAYEAINQVRRRAFGYPVHTPGSPVDLSATEVPDQVSFRNAVYHERLLEFVQEGERWFDLVRTGQYYSALKLVASKQAGVQPWDTLYPIPHQAILDNPALVQNPGYPAGQ